MYSAAFSKELKSAICSFVRPVAGVSSYPWGVPLTKKIPYFNMIIMVYLLILIKILKLLIVYDQPSGIPQTPGNSYQSV
ncbi:MAG TPA: hypothetical protein VMV77_06855 [Bacteroidales bacterium]|nr:hypothetical protein [Bacteroidales bacterium]